MEDHFVNSYLNRYHAGDASDRYFDFIHRLYEQIETYREDNACCVLDRNDFSEFYDFCVKHMNSELIDQTIQNKEVTEIQKEVSFLKTGMTHVDS